ncbi:MAG: arginine--tRNA ligase [Holosporaceae bacterium]|jgi:arginyl-tRNA synthetase|nr:arginine--tRNA ligase [Holosporaceae bacterium]
MIALSLLGDGLLVMPLEGDMLTALYLHYKNLIAGHLDPQYGDLVSVDPPKEQSFGDFSSNIGMILSKAMGQEPMAIAGRLCDLLGNNADFEDLEVRKPGFINWRVPKPVLVRHFPALLDKDFGRLDMGRGRSVNVEYVSANPTGPIHAGHARGAVSGDALARLLAYVGYRVTKEFYINDAGRQVEILAHSLYQRYLGIFDRGDGELPNWAYPGDYLIETAGRIAELQGDKFLDRDESEWLEFFKEFAVADIMKTIREDLALLDVHHDVFSSELALIADGAVDDVMELLKSKNLVYRGVLARPKGMDSEEWEEREQLLFRSTSFGDDVDRPLQKSDGSWTYFASDLAYHMDKIKRNFDELIDFWGADHGGYVKRMQAGVSAISDGQTKLEVKIVQLVRLLEDGREVKMSKRAGNFITAREIINRVGKDAVRFIMLTRRDDASLDFDFRRIIEKNRDNPVFYVQYAYARIHSVLKLFHQIFDGVGEPNVGEVDLNLLEMDGDMMLVKIIADWPRQVMMAAKNREPHRIVFFLIDLATAFHFLWNRGKESSQLRFILQDNLPRTKARILLLTAMRNVMESAFCIIGITPVEELR